MKKLLKPYDKEYMKMAMLKHEEIFREQVYELHRLYQTQKLLMKNSRGQQVKVDSNKKTSGDLEIDEEHIAESVGEDDTELELTLGLSIYNNRRRKTANNSDSAAPTFSSSNSTGFASSQIKHTTTTLAGNPRKGGHKWGLENLPVTDPSDFQLGGRQSNQNVEEQYRQDSLNNPPRLFQVLNMT